MCVPFKESESKVFKKYVKNLQLAMCKVEALMKLLRLDEAQTILASAPKIEILLPSSFTRIRFFDMISEAYTYFVKSQMELALGR